jgi:hypothetical protein
MKGVDVVHFAVVAADSSGVTRLPSIAVMIRVRSTMDPIQPPEASIVSISNPPQGAATFPPPAHAGLDAMTAMEAKTNSSVEGHVGTPASAMPE